jgi:anti-sigma regulatory factor (Ser/Thr protein kinase)/serine/threonine protein phosphatase PrpC
VGALTSALPAGAQEGVWLRQQATLAAQARRAAADLARRIGLDARRQGEIELAVTEVAVNLNKHAVDGSLLLRLVESGDHTAVELLAIDFGPGMADVGYARRDGVSSAGTLGIGLGVVERMADAFDLHSLPGRGTVLLARFAVRPGGAGGAVEAGPEPAVAGLTRPLSGEEVCGDGWTTRLVRPDPGDHGAHQGTDPTVRLVMLCDGLGHGPLAARASEQAVAAFHRTASADPAELLTALHRALSGTRGGAAAVARIDPRERRVSYCGVGNISGFVVADGRRSTLLSAPGIVGHHLPRLRVFDAELPEGSSLVMHSDGLTERWDVGAMPGLFQRSSTVIAAQLLREAGVRRDDASVVVAKSVGEGSS